MKSKLLNQQKVQRLQGLLTDMAYWLNLLDEDLYDKIDLATTAALFNADASISGLYELLDKQFQEQLDTIEFDGQRKLI